MINNPSSRKNFMKVITIVNRSFNDNHKNFRGRAREFLIDCGLGWYGVQKYSGYGVVLNDALWKDSGMGLVFWFSYERNFNFLVTIVN